MTAAAAEDALATVSCEPDVRRRLGRYIELLLAATARTNLTAARDPAAAAAHVADSLALLPYLREPFIDVGSGGGFPAVPLAIATGMRGTLLDSAAKKTRFLREIVEELGLPLAVVTERAEAAAHARELRETFACATARALGSLPAVLELTLPFLASGGVAVLQRGALEPAERQAAADAALVLGGRFEEELAQEGVRRLWIVRKVAPTNARFPRRSGVPQKRPLCWEKAGVRA